MYQKGRCFALNELKYVNQKVELFISNRGKLHKAVLIDEVKVKWKRFGEPGRLECKILRDGKIDFQEGNACRLSIDGVKFFHGFVFTKSRDKKPVIDVVIYDQLRYLKNKTWYVFEDKKASDMIRFALEDMQLKIGEVEDTQHIFDKYINDGQSVWDFFSDIVSKSTSVNGKMYALYSDFDAVTLKNVESMGVDYILTYDSMEDYSYKTSIDGATYNQIVLLSEDKKTKERKIVKSEDAENIKKWGLLRHFEKVQDGRNLQSTSNALLEIYNRKERRFEAKNAMGDLRVRGGTLIGAYLPNLGDINLKSNVLVDEVTHIFSDGKHTMDMRLYNKDMMPTFGGG